MILLDTNIFIEIYRGNTEIASVVASIEEVAVCDVVRAELFYGARDKRDLQEISSDLEEFEVLPLLSQIAEDAVGLVKTFCLSHRLEFADALIAATALHYDVELFTLNKKDFTFIPNLRFFK
jgi:predicted nucleic acid-binding protein